MKKITILLSAVSLTASASLLTLSCVDGSDIKIVISNPSNENELVDFLNDNQNLIKYLSEVPSKIDNQVFKEFFKSFSSVEPLPQLSNEEKEDIKQNSNIQLFISYSIRVYAIKVKTSQYLASVNDKIVFDFFEKYKDILSKWHITINWEKYSTLLFEKFLDDKVFNSGIATNEIIAVANNELIWVYENRFIEN